jgi:hypothetical protein
MSNEASPKLVAASEEAADIIISILWDEKVPLDLRLRAAEIIIHSGELSSRLSQLESAMKQAQEHLKWSLPG